MFTDFANVWTPVWRSRDLGRKPIGLTVAGERVVLFRDAAGRPAALIDQCPHRGVALSLGRVTPEGCLECPFHGWQFARDGGCASVPGSPMSSERRARFDAVPLAVREIGPLIWIYTRPGVAAEGEPNVPEELREPGYSVWLLRDVWSCHWTRAMENMLDSPHLPFVHRNTIGIGLRRQMKPDSKFETTFSDIPGGLRVRWTLDGKDEGAYLDFARPNGMTLHLLNGKRRMTVFVYCVPVDDAHAALLVGSARNFGLYNPFIRPIDEFNRVIIGQDKRVVESSFPLEVPHAGAEKSVASDGPTLAFRSYYLRELKGSAA